MTDYRYVIIGGGMTAHAAARGIREVDREGSIGLFSAEPDKPYKRPPLSKGLWKGDSFETIFYKTEDLVSDIRLSCPVKSIDPGQKQFADSAGGLHRYEKLLLATGATPRRLPGAAEGINYYRTVADYRRLREDAERGQRFVVIGGGFIGSEVAAGLTMNGKQVTMVFPEDGISARVFPSDLTEFVTGYYREKGVEVLTNVNVTGVETNDAGFNVTLDGGGPAKRELIADGVVAGIGVQPNVELAAGAGIEEENGIIVDQHLRTSSPDIFAAGDVASFFNPALGKRLRVEHEDNAKAMGRAAGQNMAGKQSPYDYLPFFYSDLFDLGYEAVGEVDPRLEIVSDWKEPYREGVVYYLRDGRVRGVLLWNVWNQVKGARRLIEEPGPFTAESLSGRLPEPK
jgi:NADPH-dependent 2,4-dienoyl-CoA reductase/sulfur reductase-like enzyme